jgi:hypothetical protein
MRARRCVAFAAACAVIALATGCGEDVPELQVASPDLMTFETQVYPVLLRDCGFHHCHSSSERFLQVFGPGRDRMLDTTQPLDPVLPEEVGLAYNRARSMIDTAKPDASLLLRKPLAVAAGGTGHQGEDVHGRDVYEDEMAPGYLVLQAWVAASTASQDTGGGVTLPPSGAAGMTTP